MSTALEPRQIEPLLLSAAQAAALCGIGRSLFYSLHSSQELGPLPLKLGCRTLWRRKELETWISEGCLPRKQFLLSRSAER